MDANALKKAIAKDGLAPVYLLQGSEQLRIEDAVRVIVEAAVDDPNDPMSVTRVDLAEGKRSAKDVIAACRSIGLFVSRTAVVVRAAELLDKKKDEREEMTKYVTEPVRAATLILKASKLNGSTSLVKRIKKNGKVFTYNELKGREAVGWTQSRAKSLGHGMDWGAAQLVCELVGTNLMRLSQTVDQLSLFVGREQPITEQAAEELLAATRSHSIFELVDAVGQRRTASALRHLSGMLEHREPPLRILAMLIRHFRFLWQVGALRAAGKSPDAAASLLKLHPFQAKKMYQQATKFDDHILRTAYERLYETDVRLKSSRLDGRVIMERLVMDLCAGRRA